MSNEGNFEGRSALVTGGVRRLGFAIARAIAEKRANLFVTYFSSSPEEVSAAVDALLAAGAPSVTPLRCDLADPTELEDLCEKVGSGEIAVDYLVNSAASFVHEPLSAVTGESFDETIALNLRAPLLLSQAASSAMKAKRFGRIVSIADVAAIVPFPGYISYSISKAGVIAMTRALAKALAPEVLVNCVAPGPVLLPDEFDENDASSAVEPTLLKRSGTPDEVARAVVLLLETSYITGVTLPVDGGRLLR